MKLVEDITSIFGSTPEKIRIKNEIEKSLLKKIDEKSINWRSFKQNENRIQCKVLGDYEYNFAVTVSEINGVLMPVLSDEIFKKPVQIESMLLVGNGFSRLEIANSSDPLNTKNLCSSSICNCPDLKKRFEEIAKEKYSYEDNIGFLRDSIELNNDLNLKKEYIIFKKNVIDNILNVSKPIKNHNSDLFWKALIEKKPHIATLNYDPIIYRKLMPDESIKKEYTDGFIRKNENDQLKFNSSFLKSNYFRKKKCYLHLHGSCLFNMAEHDIVKELLANARNNNMESEALIVLTSSMKKYSEVHSEHKFNNILHAYNKIFEDIVSRCDRLTILGYGASDLYLNETISEALLINKNQPKIYFIETFNDSGEKNYNAFKKYLIESSLDSNKIKIVLDNMNFQHFNKVENWDQII